MTRVLKALALVSIVATTSAYAGGIKIQSCFTRTYSADHLKQNPGQYAREFKFALGYDNYGNIYGLPFLRDQKNGAWLTGGTCQVDPSENNSNDNIYACGVDDDGGKYQIDINPFAGVANLVVKNYVRMEPKSGPGTLTLQNGRTNGVYKLIAAPKSECSELLQ